MNWLARPSCRTGGTGGDRVDAAPDRAGKADGVPPSTGNAFRCNEIVGHR